MDYLALYRKYRPKELDEVVGQSEIKKILASSVENGTITHAYLFSGPRGTGKTTMAKILAKMVNCLHPINGNACNECEICLNILNSSDVIEIDAASNNGVDEIRDLREKANLVPSNAKYKVYIIDEVHMLTTQAFNALLKTLEEPPRHVIFVLATTEYYKIPLTITSRCQKFQFNKINNNDIVDRLKYIAKQEKIKIDDEAMQEIAKISDGGMRDSINFLDQLRSFSAGKITINDVYEVCGNVSSGDILSLFTAIRNNDCEKITSFFEKMDANGKNYGKFLESIVEFLKDSILLNKNVSHKYIKNDIDNIKEFNTIFNVDEMFYILECLNNLIDKLKNVSKQSITIITNFLIMMNKINSNNNLEMSDLLNSDSNKLDNKYDMAFQFTSDNVNDGDKFTDNNQSLSEKVVDKADTDNLKNTNDFNINKEIIINNCFAVASKEIKNTLQSRLEKINEYLTDKKFKVAAGSLVDVKLEVAGHEYVIFSAESDAIVQKIYDNYKLCHELINMVFEGNYNFVVLYKDEWNIYRDEYVLNFKSGKKYTLKEFSEVQEERPNIEKEATVVDKLFDLLGEENIEFK